MKTFATFQAYMFKFKIKQTGYSLFAKEHRQSDHTSKPTLAIGDAGKRMKMQRYLIGQDRRLLFTNNVEEQKL